MNQIANEIKYGKEINDKDPKFTVGDIVRITKYKNILAECYTPKAHSAVGIRYY